MIKAHNIAASFEYRNIKVYSCTMSNARVEKKNEVQHYFTKILRIEMTYREERTQTNALCYIARRKDKKVYV